MGLGIRAVVRLCGVGFLLLLAPGCAALFRAPGPVAPALSEGPDVLVDWFREHVGATPSVKALLQISVHSPEGSLSFNGVLFSERPSSLRLQGFSPLGQRLFDLMARGEMVTLRMENEQRYFEGTIDELGEGLRFPALPHVLGLMAAVMIAPPDASQAILLEEVGTGNGAALSFYLGSGDDRQLTRRIWLDRQRRPLREEWYGPGGQVTAAVRYSDYHVVEQRWQPYQVEARLDGNVSVKVTIKELQLNPVWRPDDFHIHGMPHAIARG